MYRFGQNIVMIENHEKILLFNSLNSEIVIMPQTKLEGDMSDDEVKALENIGMFTGNTEGYCIHDYYPTHISKAYILFGTDCNIDCKYCTVKHNAQKYSYKSSMDKETLINCLDFLFTKNFGLEHITLYGGEPMLHKDRLLQFFDYLEKLPKEKIPRIDLITNGLIVDKCIIERVLKWDVLVLISLDGMEKHHDIFRKGINNEKTYSRVISGIKQYQASGAKVGISMVLGKHNYKDIEKICTYLKQTYNIVSIGLTLPHMEPDVALDNEFEKFIENEYDKLLDVCQKQELWFEQGMKRLLSLAKKELYIYGCPTSKQGCMVRFLPDGNITLCENMGLRGLYILGNANDAKLSAEDIFKQKEFINWYNRCTNNNQQCKNCMAYSVCGMGCPYDAFLQNGNIDTFEWRSCKISKQAIQWYLRKVLEATSLSEDSIKILSIEERKKVIVEYPL